MIKLINEDQLLDERFRKNIIKEITSDANVERKKKALKSYEIYKDLTKKWVIEAISKEFSQKTVEQMINRAANISICRKIVDKRAKAYSGGVERAIEGDEANTAKLKELADVLNFNQLMKKADRFSELLKNCEIQALYQNDPLESLEDGSPKKTLVNRIMLPHQYDVLLHPHDCRTPVAFVLSDFHDTTSVIWNNLASDYTGYREPNQPQVEKAVGKAQESKTAQTYIWWTAKYHFTTDDKGKIIGALSPVDGMNPIGRLPFASVHGDQDDSYWCDGGNDLVDGSILINVLLTDMFSIMNVQGWGQLVVTGKKVPQDLTGGPHRALVFEYDTGDPAPSVEYASSNPPIAEWREAITMYVALLLSTNNLSTRNVSTKLDGSTQMASGIALMIDSSESTENVEDKQNMFKEAEAKAWKNNFAAQNYLFETGTATDRLVAIGKVETNSPVKVKFNQMRPILSEQERVEILAKKKESGLYEIPDLIMIENPDLSRKDAEKKALALVQDKMKYAVLYQAAVTKTVEAMNQELDSEEDQAEGETS